jgi:threonine aldolase
MAPEALDAVVRSNSGFVSAYGGDEHTARAADLIRGLLDADAEVHFVSSGTAANAVCLAAMARPHETVAAHEHAHVFTDEAAAASFFGHGLGATPLPGASGRIAPEVLQAVLDGPHPVTSQAPGVLSLSNATEYGAVYAAGEIAALTAAARGEGLAVHLDGARLANAAAAGFDVKRLEPLGVDIAVIGGTKAGLPASEAIAILNPAFGKRFATRLKQAGQAISKARFAASAWVAMLDSGAWLQRARHANAMAGKLAGLMPFDLTHPVQANAVFVRMDEAARARLAQRGWKAFAFADGSTRFMCSWATTEAMVEELGQALTGIA